MFQNIDGFNYELVAREGGQLRHYYRPEKIWDRDSGKWISDIWLQGQLFGYQIVGDPVMFQNRANKAYELVVREGGQLRHYWFTYASGNNWAARAIIWIKRYRRSCDVSKY